MLSDFYTVLQEEVPGRYMLISVCGGNEFSDELLTRLRELGFPLILELYADGTSILAIFDQAVIPAWNTDSLQFYMNGRTLPFFYLNGYLRIQDGNSFLVFAKQ